MENLPVFLKCKQLIVRHLKKKGCMKMLCTALLNLLRYFHTLKYSEVKIKKKPYVQ